MTKTNRRLISLLLVAATSAACSKAATPPIATNTASVNTKTVAVTKTEISYDGDDEYTDWKQQNPTYIELKGSSASFTGANVSLNGNKTMILSAGVYVLSGKLDDGQIVVDTQNKGTVRLVFNGVEIQSKSGAPVHVKKADKAVITLQEGTQNLVSDAKTYASSGDDQPNAAIYSDDDLTINGTGALTVQGNYNNGIMSKDDLKIMGGKIAINAVDDGLIGRDMLAIKQGSFTIQAGGDGIRSSNDTDSAKGYINIEGGTFAIKSGSDGIQAETALQIAGGTFTITTNGGSDNGVVHAADNGPVGGGPGMAPRGGGAQPAPVSTTKTDSKSAKALKAGADILISGGTFKIDSADDAIHGNNIVTIAGGEFAITSGDDGVHADAALNIQGGKVDITKSYEGLESKLITITGGETSLVASDDGINVAGGADQSAMGGRPGQNNFSASGDVALHIGGGKVTVDALGDGLDANGSIFMTDGTVIVNGPTANNNGPIDYDGVFKVTGGLIIAAGSAGMAQAPSTDSTQYALGLSFSQVQPAGQEVTLKDSDGKSIVTFAPKRQYQSFVVSSPDLKKGGSYTFYTGSNKLVSFSVSNIVTWLNESGVTSGPAGARGPRR